MRKRIAVFGSALVLVGALIGVSYAAGSRSTGIVEHQFRSFALTSFHEQDLDVAPSGRSLGDTFFFQQQLWTFDLKTKVGRYDSACVLEDAGTSLNQCTATAFLGDGTVELSGRLLFTDTLQSFKLAVIGGTGRYDNVVGQATITFGCVKCPAGTQDVDTLSLALTPSFQRP